MGAHDIGWATRCLKQGSRVRRPHWGEGFFVQEHVVNIGHLRTVNILLIHMPSLGRIQQFTCHHDDMYTDDWELAQ